MDGAMTVDLPALAEKLMDLAAREGAEAADVIATSAAAVSIDVRQGALEHAERAEGIEIGLRVLIGRRQACVSASDARLSTLSRMAERAVAMAREAPEDPSVGLADPSQLAQVRDASGLDIADRAAEPAAGALSDLALRTEAAAREVQGVTQVEQASAAYHRRFGWLAATNGFSGGYERTETSLSCVAICGEGLSMERDWYAEGRAHRDDLPPPEYVGRMAGERTVARAGAKRPPTGAFPVLYDERVASSLIGHLVQAVNGSMIVRGASWLRDALGRQVLPSGLSLIEDPHRPRVGNSRPFDAEGLATSSRAIVEDGVLTGWTLDLGTARKLGMQSTASAARAPSGPPSPIVTNIDLTQGSASQADLMSEMGTGLLVTSMIGSSVNATTGDYSRGASGFWVENGQIAYPVNECTIAGNLRDMLLTIRPANDALPWVSRRIPSLLVDGMTIAGA
jgi:PmbA protein